MKSQMTELNLFKKRADLRYSLIENFILKFPNIVASKLPAGLQKSVNLPEVTEQVWVFA